MTILLGGSASPVGWSVQYVDAKSGVVLDALLAWRRGLGQELEVSQPEPFPQVLSGFVPFQSPWNRELVLGCGSWTAYLNNNIGGGDLTAAVALVADQLGVRWVGAQHTPVFGPGHQATQLWVCGPGGEPPLMYERTLTVSAQDGRWSWDESGRPFPFEDLSRYRARRKRDRFDRALLLTYLKALGIPADDDSAYGAGVVVEQQVRSPRPPRVLTVDEARAELLG